jgi:hypothetical protein
LMPLAAGAIGTPDSAARDRWWRGAAISRDLGPPANPPGVDDLRLFASLILRQVRANRGTVNASVHIARSTSSSRRPSEARPRGHGQADQHPITGGESLVPVHTLFAELASRHVHSGTMEGTAT